MSNRKKLPSGFDDEQWLSDQHDATAADAAAQVGRLASPGSITLDSDTAGQIPAANRLAQMAAAQVTKPGNLSCGHFKPRHIEPQHWFPVHPDRWFCDRCAQPVITRYEAVADWCDLCQRGYLHEELTVIHMAQGGVIIHAALCDSCAPGDST